MSGDNIEETPRFCLERDHELFYATLHCTFDNCDQKSRWICASCLYHKLHQHGQQETMHVIKEDILIQQTQNVKEIVSTKLIHHIDNLKTEMIKQQEELQYSLYDCSIINYVNSQEFIYNQNQCLVQVEKLIGIIKQFQNVLLIMIQQFKTDVGCLNQHLIKEKQVDHKIWEQGFCYEELNTSFQLLGDTEQHKALLKPQNQHQNNHQNILNHIQKQNVDTKIIIHDNVLVREKQNNIQLFDLENKSLKKLIQSKTAITCIGFNLDNTILFYGDIWGFVYGFLVNKSYKLLFKLKSTQLEYKIHLFQL